jgi:hypothetical protein
MTADDFRNIALALPGAVEGGHMGHPDFRAHDKVFATLGYPNDAWGMVKLEPDEQLGLVAALPEMFKPVKGVWGERGATNVRLDAADATAVAEAMHLAYAAIDRKRAGKATTKRPSR